jgi:HNH endonuclease
MPPWSDPDARVMPEPNTGCLLWLGHVNRDGYGRLRPRGARQMVMAHRWFWERVHGVIPAGMTIDHRCRQRACVEAAHLHLVSAVENTRLGASRRPVCPRCGGPWFDGRRQRVCRACERRSYAMRA